MTRGVRTAPAKNPMTLKDQVDEYRKRMAVLNRWESEQPPLDRSPAAIVADLGLIWTWMSVEERQFDPDPEKLGIQRMRAGLARLQVK
jgi:hypothetical protein